MNRRKITHILFLLGVLSFLLEPFLGFGLFNKNHQPDQSSILVKIFSKRKLEYDENSHANFTMVQKKLAGPAPCCLLFATLLTALFPVIFLPGIKITTDFLRRLGLRPAAGESLYLLNGKLLI